MHGKFIYVYTYMYKKKTTITKLNSLENVWYTLALFKKKKKNIAIFNIYILHIHIQFKR